MSQARRIALIDDLRARPAEEDWFEFKGNNSDPSMIGQKICALANSARLVDRHFGYIVWGTKDGTHDIVGTTFPLDQEKASEPFEMWLAKMRPSPPFRFIE